MMLPGEFDREVYDTCFTSKPSDITEAFLSIYTVYDGPFLVPPENMLGNAFLMLKIIIIYLL